jgi:hypothetical protein
LLKAQRATIAKTIEYNKRARAQLRREIKAIAASESEFKARHEPDAKNVILLDDGKGGFKTIEVSSGIANNESKIADPDVDGDYDVLGKPYGRQRRLQDNRGVQRHRQPQIEDRRSGRRRRLRRPWQTLRLEDAATGYLAQPGPITPTIRNSLAGAAIAPDSAPAPGTGFSDTA